MQLIIDKKPVGCLAAKAGLRGGPTPVNQVNPAYERYRRKYAWHRGHPDRLVERYID